MNTHARVIRTIYAFMVAMLLTFTASHVFIDTATAKPKEVSEFDKLVKAGAKAYDDGDFVTAETSFRQAYALEQDASLLYNIGRVCEDKADYNCAIESYKQYIGASGADAEAKSDAFERIETCSKYLSVLGSPAQPAPAGKKAASAPAPVAVAAPGNCIDINTASATQLETINGLGPAKSKAIIAYRNTHKFTNLNQLLDVKGIGDSTLQKFMPYLCPINNVAAPAPAPVAAPAPAAPKTAASTSPSTPKSAKSAPKANLKASNSGSNIEI